MAGLDAARLVAGVAGDDSVGELVQLVEEEETAVGRGDLITPDMK